MFRLITSYEKSGPFGVKLSYTRKLVMKAFLTIFEEFKTNSKRLDTAFLVIEIPYNGYNSFCTYAKFPEN